MYDRHQSSGISLSAIIQFIRPVKKLQKLYEIFLFLGCKMCFQVWAGKLCLSMPLMSRNIMQIVEKGLGFQQKISVDTLSTSNNNNILDTEVVVPRFYYYKNVWLSQVALKPTIKINISVALFAFPFNLPSKELFMKHFFSVIQTAKHLQKFILYSMICKFSYFQVMILFSLGHISWFVVVHFSLCKLSTY